MGFSEGWNTNQQKANGNVLKVLQKERIMVFPI